MQTVLITGATSGIGLLIANLLHEKGYKVYGTSRMPEKQRLIPYHLNYWNWILPPKLLLRTALKHFYPDLRI